MVVGFIARILAPRGWSHVCRTDIARIILPEIRQRNNVPCSFSGCVSVGHPDFDPRDVDRAVYQRKINQGLVVAVPEILSQEEVPVDVVVSCPELEFIEQGSSLGRH